MSKKLVVGGQQRTVPAYYEGQNSSGSPNHYETFESADKMRQSGRARSINRGKAILIKGPRRPLTPTRDSVKQGWKLVGQTCKKSPIKPGFPRWSAV